MNAQQRLTVRGIAVVISLMSLAVCVGLVVEGMAVSSGGNSTISELVWLAWASQPGAVLIVSHMLAAPFWYLCGHFFWQSQKVYDAIRKDGL